MTDAGPKSTQPAACESAVARVPTESSAISGPPSRDAAMPAAGSRRITTKAGKMDRDASSPAGTRPTAGYLQVPLGALAVASTCVALTCLAALVVVASLKDVQALATVALALAVIAFVAQLIVFVVQASTANQRGDRGSTKA
jgi:hypothetical protein